MPDKCVIDIGMHDGSDTIMYLSQGYYVFAVEANPLMAEERQKRIPAKFAGQYEILPYAVTKYDCKAEPFYVNHQTYWSSFNPVKGTKLAPWIPEGQPNGLNKVIHVDCISVKTLYEKFVRPKFEYAHYAKIDVEGKDFEVLCGFAEVTRPTYISCELGDLRLLHAMADMGYKEFKVVRQNDIINKRVQITTSTNNILEYSLEESCSGPFGVDLHDWCDYAAAEKEITSLDTKYWYDLHAK